MTGHRGNVFSATDQQGIGKAPADECNELLARGPLEGEAGGDTDDVAVGVYAVDGLLRRKAIKEAVVILGMEGIERFAEGIDHVDFVAFAL